WLQQARASLSQGWLLAIDYALSAQRYYAPQRDGGTLLACRGQRTSSDLLADPGRQDITAHVCSTLLEHLAPQAGWHCRGTALQGEVLLQLGLAAEISALSEPGPQDLASRLARREELLRLVDPYLLGGFWWFWLEAQSQPAAPTPFRPPGWWPEAP
ncbi:MAG: SAM-dependent methyltransferase, partial [Synechococcus sp. TMED155]